MDEVPLGAALAVDEVPPLWLDAALAAALFAVDPHGLGGVALRAGAGPARDEWLATLRALLPPAAPTRRLPLHITDSRLLGGLDLAATLSAGRPVAERGLLSEADGGVVIVPMAERMPPGLAARLASVIDTGEVALERDGLAQRLAARVGLVALDEGAHDDERLPGPLVERLALLLDLSVLRRGETIAPLHDADQVAAARQRLARVETPLSLVAALCQTAAALGVASLRAPLLALRVARAAAALAGRDTVEADDAASAARLVLAPRATVLPFSPPQEQEGEDDALPPEPQPDESGRPRQDREQDHDQDHEQDESAAAADMQSLVLESARAAIPPRLLAQLAAGVALRAMAPSAGRGAAVRSTQRGRPLGVRRGEARGGNRLNLIETLRAAAPWQPLRRSQRDGAGPAASIAAARVEVRREDFRVQRFKQRAQNTAIFVVDASGSAALNRLAEAKGAVELFLADCYVRRDQVALIAFRGQGAELLLAPTRSLARAKRSLAGLPGGGGTPLAAALRATLALADSVRRRGDRPLAVLLTDGRGNVALDGSHGRAQADADALAVGRQLRAAGLRTLLIDTSPRSHPQAQKLAAAIGARYLPLPYADAGSMARAVQAAAG